MGMREAAAQHRAAGGHKIEVAAVAPTRWPCTTTCRTKDAGPRPSSAVMRLGPRGSPHQKSGRARSAGRWPARRAGRPAWRSSGRPRLPGTLRRNRRPIRQRGTPRAGAPCVPAATLASAARSLSSRPAPRLHALRQTRPRNDPAGVSEPTGVRQPRGVVGIPLGPGGTQISLSLLLMSFSSVPKLTATGDAQQGSLDTINLHRIVLSTQAIVEPSRAEQTSPRQDLCRDHYPRCSAEG